MSSTAAPDPTDAELTLAVVGAGAMGAGIAQVAAQAGHPVHLVDARAGAAAQAKEKLTSVLTRLAAKGKITSEQAADTADRIVIGAAADGDLDALPPVGLVIEAVVEDLAVKRQLFGRLAATQSEQTILATNTSSLDIDAIAEPVPGPGRVLGLHFFNPAALMKLVEVVAGSGTDERVAQRAAALVQSWGKTPVRCTSSPGFIVNRVARPFYGEAQRMVEQGLADPATVDAAMRQLGGFRMGPLELTDLIGQDVNLAVGTSVWEQTDRDPRYAPTAYQQELVAAGHLGRKTGRGVYHYDADGQALDAAADPERVAAMASGPLLGDPVRRTIAMLVNEAVDLAHRGIAEPGDIDVAMTLGTNYPQGPFAWLEQIGADTVRQQLAELDSAHPGGRYRLSPALAP